MMTPAFRGTSNFVSGLKIVSLTLCSLLVLGACKPKEISVAHIESVLGQDSFLGMPMTNCRIRFEINNPHAAEIDHLGFTVTLRNPQRSSNISDHVRYSDLPSGTNTFVASFPKGACDTGYTVEMAGFSCRMGQDDCAEHVSISE